jgi:hypothetical protein
LARTDFILNASTLYDSGRGDSRKQNDFKGKSAHMRKSTKSKIETLLTVFFSVSFNSEWICRSSQFGYVVEAIKLFPLEGGRKCSESTD